MKVSSKNLQRSTPVDIKQHPKVAIIGGPDVNARIPLILKLREFKFSVLGSKQGLANQFSQAGLSYFPYHLHRGTNPLYDIRTLFSLIRLFRQIRPQIVHTFDTKPGVWGRLAARLSGVPIIVGTLPGLGSLYVESNLRSRLTQKIYEPLQKLTCHLSDLTIFQNPDDAKEFIQRGITPPQKVAVILGSGVDTQRFSPRHFNDEQRFQIREQLGISNESLIVTMISRLLRTKGVLEFIKAAIAVTGQYSSEINFLLVGPDDQENIDALTKEEKELVSATVTCLGQRNDIPMLLSISDILVLPSYYREGIPRILLEAASMGLPIVTTDTPGCREVVEDGINGLLVAPRVVEPLAEAIFRLVVDPQMRKRFGEASRRRAVTQFDLEIIARETGVLYWKLLVEKNYYRKTI